MKTKNTSCVPAVEATFAFTDCAIRRIAAFILGGAVGAAGVPVGADAVAGCGAAGGAGNVGFRTVTSGVCPTSGPVGECRCTSMVPPMAPTRLVACTRNSNWVMSVKSRRLYPT
ncbi:MAG: hypothetical protein LH606_00265 [Cytophagaceae bacterium]|nr:hypothetical protein [Cytophagaceae bacterium]